MSIHFYNRYGCWSYTRCPGFC